MESVSGESADRSVGATDYRLVFEAHWASEEPPLYQECVAELTLPSGELVTQQFGISVGNSQEVVVLLSEENAGAQVKIITCGH